MGIKMNKSLKIRTAACLSVIMILTNIFPVCASEIEAETETIAEEAVEAEVQAEDDFILSDTADVASVNHSYAEEIHLGECRYLSVSGDRTGYTWKVSDNRILSVNPDGRCKGLSSDSVCGYSETVVTAEKDGKKYDMWIKVLPAMCVDCSTIGVPGAKWNISGMFKEAAGKIRYRATNKKVMKVNKDGVAKGKKKGKTDIIKEVKSGSSWIEVDRESFEIIQPKIKSEMLVSRLKSPTLSANKIIISSNVLPAGFRSSKSSVISVEGDKLKFNKMGSATIYTLFGTVGKPLKRYKTRIEVIGKD